MTKPQIEELRQIESDKDLFAMIATGSHAAFSQCVHRFTPHLFPYIKSIIHTDMWAEDLLQDLYTKIWNGRKNLTLIENPAAYMTRIAANLALDFIKHKAVEVKAQYRISRQAYYVQNHVESVAYDANFYGNLLKQAIESLTPQQKKVYNLRYSENLSYEEIATLLELSRNTVRNHLVAAMEVLREYFKKNGDGLLVFFLIFFLYKFYLVHIVH